MAAGAVEAVVTALKCHPIHPGVQVRACPRIVRECVRIVRIVLESARIVRKSGRIVRESVRPALSQGGGPPLAFDTAGSAREKAAGRDSPLSANPVRRRCPPSLRRLADRPEESRAVKNVFLNCFRTLRW